MSILKPAYTTSIVQVKAGAVIPETLLRKLAQENPSAFGMVVREPDKLVVEKFPHIDDVEKNIALMLKVQEGTKKYPVMFCFHSFPPEFDEDEVQPYQIIRDSKGNAILVAAVEGDFPGRENEEYSEAHVLVNEWLGPKIEDMYKLVGNSPQKLIEYLHSAQFQNDFKNVYAHRGVMAFMPTIGEPFVIESNDLGLVGPWGSVSNAYGYTESAIEAATAEAAAPAKPASKLSKYVDDAPAAPAPAPKPASVPPKADPQPAKPEEKVAAELQPEEIDWSPPKGLHGKPLKSAYRAVNDGVLPTNWRDRPTIRIKTKKSVKSLQDLSQTSAAALTGAKDMKTVSPKPAENKVLTMPIISGAQQAKAVEMIKKYLGDGSGVIDDPVKANEQESKLATFSQLVLKTGKLDEINRWTTAFIFAFVKENPETAALAVIELRSAWRRARDAGKTLSELTGTELPVAPAAPAPQPEAPTAPAAPAPSKYSKYA